MDRLPSSHHPDSCGCAQCKVFGTSAVRLNERLGLPPLVRFVSDLPCLGRANGCNRRCCQPRRARAARPTLVALDGGKPRFAAAREREAA